MNSNVNIEYANAYSEVIEVLNHMSKEDYDKIPKEMIDMFQTNCNNEHQYRYDLKKEFEEQEISKRAKLILAILYIEYWATPVQRKIIIAKQNLDRQKIEQQKAQKYPQSNLFKRNTIIKKEEQIEEKDTDKILISLKKENILKRIINKIKSIFKSNKS